MKKIKWILASTTIVMPFTAISCMDVVEKLDANNKNKDSNNNTSSTSNQVASDKEREAARLERIKKQREKEAKLSELDAQLKSKQREARIKQVEVNGIIARLNNLGNEAVSAAEAQKAEEIKATETQIRELQTQIETAKTEIATLTNELSDTETLKTNTRTKIETLTSEIPKLEAQKPTVEEVIRGLETQLTDAKTAFNTENTKNEEKIKAINAKKAEYTVLKNAYDALLSSYSSTDISRLNAENDRLTAEKVKEEDLKTLIEAANTYYKTDAKTAMDAYKGTRTKAAEKLNDMKESLKTKVKEALENNLREYWNIDNNPVFEIKSIISSSNLTPILNRYARSVSSANSLNEDNRSKVDEYMKVIQSAANELETKITALQAKLIEADKKIATPRDPNPNKYNNVGTTYKNLDRSFTMWIQEVDKKINTIAETIKSNEDQIKASSASEKEKQQQVEAKRVELEKKAKEFMDEYGFSIDRPYANPQEWIDARNKVNELETQLRDKQTELTNITATITSKTNEKNRLQSELDNFPATVEAKKAEKAQKEQKVSELENNISAKRTELEAIRNRDTNVGVDNTLQAQLTSEKQAKEAELAQLNQEIKQIETQISEVQNS
ncbi:hypothetical protein ACJA23_01835 [Mycoplasma corogypsi]|uniref:hypothetical protein n=1 Tax=Mycoplasma corogypsi TaxID=2106 RepID=UPI003873A87A